MGNVAHGDRYPLTMFGIHFPFSIIRVVGLSMEPELRNGELWLVKRGNHRIVRGNVITFTLPSRPHMLQVKRVIWTDNCGVWVEGDNSNHSTDSREFGKVPHEHVSGKLVRKIKSN